MKMQPYQIKTIFFISVAWVIAVVGNGCGASFTGAVDNSSLIAGGTELPVEQKTSFGIKNINQVLPNMVNLTGYRASVNVLQQRFDSRKAALSVNGRADSVNAPMLLSIASMSIEMCDQLVENQEAAYDRANQPEKKRFFKNVNLETDSAVEGQERVWIEQMARDFWGRNASTDELAMIERSVASANFNGNQLKLKGKYICAAMLAALESNIIR